MTAGSSQNAEGTSSTQTNGGESHQSPLRAPSPIQVIQGKVELEQIQVEDWEDEAFEDEATAEVGQTRVQQEIERLRQGQEAITRKQAVARRAEARRQHINRERARLAELQYNIEIIHQQGQRQEPPLEHPHH
jgi:hypothetical protein